MKYTGKRRRRRQQPIFRWAVLIPVGCVLLATLYRQVQPMVPAPSAETDWDLPVTHALSFREITVLTEDGVRSMASEEYLVGVVAAEMPASFSRQALMAQAVSARTYLMSRLAQENPNHPQADICTQASCCMAWASPATMRSRWGDDWIMYREKIVSAVSETRGEYLTWQGMPIQSVFHAASAGRTAASDELWNALPYLISVSTPETAADVPDYVSTVTVSAEEFRRCISSAAPEVSLSGTPEQWIGSTSLTQSGRVDFVEIGGVPVSGETLRTLFSLRSSMFSIDCSPAEIRFTVTGYGHGVGMSQYGANVMAVQGNDYREILAHYYPGTELAGGVKKNMEQVPLEIRTPVSS